MGDVLDEPAERQLAGGGALPRLLLAATASEGRFDSVVATDVSRGALAVAARNAARPLIALGQLTLSALPVSVALAFSGDPPLLMLAAINLLERWSKRYAT